MGDKLVNELSDQYLAWKASRAEPGSDENHRRAKRHK